MASAALRDETLCSICLITYTDPVMLRCGHNFCRVCIDRVLDTQDQSGVYSCPECREEFQERPALIRNLALSKLIDNFLFTPPTQTETGMFCSHCIHSPVPAVKSSLHCEASLCDDHLNVHSKSPEHVLTDPSTSLENKKCSVHKKVLEYYCTEDAACICVYCSAGEHRGHLVEKLDEASKKKKKKLRNVLQKLIKREKTEEKVQSLEERRRKAQILTDSSTSLRNKKCSVHKKILEYYCTEDAACICVSCRLDGGHWGHQVEMLDEASEKKKKKLRDVLQKQITKREETEGRVESLEEHRRKAQEKASGEAKRVTALFIDIRKRLDNLEKRVLSEISRQEEKLSRSLSDVIQKLEIKKDKLFRKMRHIEELCNMTDPLTVLQDPDTGDLCDPEEGRSEEDTGGHDKIHAVDDLDVTVISDTFHTLCDIISGIRSGIYEEGPTDILLDVNTAGNNLLISDDLKTATETREMQNRPETAERFQYNQVMSRRRFTSGRHYWDVEGSSSGWWMVGMCYPSIDSRGHESFIGNNNKSWSLERRLNNLYLVVNDNKEIPLPDEISSDRVRICLDYEAGQLSFYELCDPIRHLHTFTTTFTEPLHAVLYVHRGSIKILGGGRNCEKPS